MINDSVHVTVTVYVMDELIDLTLTIVTKLVFTTSLDFIEN